MNLSVQFSNKIERNYSEGGLNFFSEEHKDHNLQLGVICYDEESSEWGDQPLEMLHREAVGYLGDFQKLTEGLKQSNLALKATLLLAEVRIKLFKSASKPKFFWYIFSANIWYFHLVMTKTHAAAITLQ